MKWNIAIQIAIFIINWKLLNHHEPGARLHQDTGRFGAAWLGTGELTDLKTLGLCFPLNSWKYRKNSGPQSPHWGVFNLHPPDWYAAPVISSSSLSSHIANFIAPVISYTKPENILVFPCLIPALFVSLLNITFSLQNSLECRWAEQ